MGEKNKFGAASAARLSTCHIDLQKIFNVAIRRSHIDFSIVEGQRSYELQKQYFEQGKSRLNPDNPEHLKSAKHLMNPSMAVDIVAFVPTNRAMAYDAKHLSFIAGVVIAVAEELFSKGEISHLIRWGGNWDADGEIIEDQDFDDLPHFELIEVKR